ncbi:T9SS type A sorting domain-containing protein [Candidatus Desantisbacteria bacterium]|nr:T9SS type A sorting domain-containing protein [Candidatus Desantisbacteria bacterium]
MEESGVYSNRDFVWAKITHLSLFGIAGIAVTDPGGAIVYPNPFCADKHTCIYFSQLPTDSTIQIFTVAGELVREIRANSWDVCNSDGEKVASGIYLYLITDPAGNKKAGKLGVIQ